jgi:hypothetical protein
LFEQNIINIANEFDDKKLTDSERLFKFVLETAWEQNNSLSADEANLIEKLRTKLQISRLVQRIFEVKIGRYPKYKNIIHTRPEIDNVRKVLQQFGLLFCIRDSHNENIDIIPDEIAKCLNQIYGKEMRNFGYRQLITNKNLKNKEYLQGILERGNVVLPALAKLGDLQKLVFDRIKPSNLLCGFSPKDGLDKEVLSLWCGELNLPVAGTKDNLAGRIIEYYDGVKEIKVDTTDTREILFQYFEQLASRDIKDLRKQGIIIKDLECEHNFEQATNYIFEKLLKHKPLIMTGTEHPDGLLSFQNKLIMWDNKSKETPVKLKDHIVQFQRYINKSEKPVGIFIVLAAEFTNDSIDECIKFSLRSDTFMLLLRAADLKQMAVEWRDKHRNDDLSFDLAYFKQNGLFNKTLVKF